MFNNKYYLRRALWLLIMTSTSLLAGGNQVYLGLTIGDDQAKVKKTLEERHADFSDHYGYKGYTDLPMIMISRDSNMSRHGQVKDA